jgi:hypothetical protein
VQGPGKSCGEPTFSGVNSDADKQAIIDAHNTVRRKVAKGKESRGNPGPQPPAANMRKMVSGTADRTMYPSHCVSSEVKEWTSVYYYSIHYLQSHRLTR